MIGVTVSTEFHDYLSIVIPLNASHFERWVIVTHPEDSQTIGVVSRYPQCEILLTECIFDNGACFNKYAAVQLGIRRAIRDGGWMCLIDSDIVLPPTVDQSNLRAGNVYCPRRRLVRDPQSPRLLQHWQRHRLQPRDAARHSGHCLVFHTSDPALAGPSDWFPNHFVWAGSGVAGSGHDVFLKRWTAAQQLRPRWDVLELCQNQNPCGRWSAYLDGTPARDSQKRFQAAEVMIRQSRLNAGLDDKFQGDRVGQQYQSQ